MLEALKASLMVYFDDGIQNIVSIYVTGSLGRQEAAFIKDSSGNLRLYNDVDLLIVVNTPLSTTDILRLENFIKDATGVQWVDILQAQVNELRRLHTTIKNFDLINGSFLLYGRDCKGYFPTIGSRSLGSYDLSLLFFTRLYAFISSALVLAGDDHDVDSGIYVGYQLCKAVFAGVDANLLRVKSYHSSYEERARLFNENNPSSEWLPLVDWAASYKLRPEPILGKDELRKLFNRVISFYISEFDQSFKYFNKVSISNPCKFEKWYKRKHLISIKRIYRIIRYRKDHSFDEYCVNLSQFHYFHGLAYSDSKPRSEERSKVLLSLFHESNESISLAEALMCARMQL